MGGMHVTQADVRGNAPPAVAEEAQAVVILMQPVLWAIVLANLRGKGLPHDPYIKLQQALTSNHATVERLCCLWGWL